MGSQDQQPAARLGDIDTGKPKHPPTPIIGGSGNVFVNGRPAARQGDPLAPHPCPRSILEGASTVLINGRPAARVTDGVSCGASVIIGSGNVVIGNSPKLGPAGPSAAEFAATVQAQLARPRASRSSLDNQIIAAEQALNHRGSEGATASWHDWYLRNSPAAGELSEPCRATGYARAYEQRRQEAANDASLTALLAEQAAVEARLTAAHKAVQPASLEDCLAQLAQRREQLTAAKAAAGDGTGFYQPKYSDAELLAQAAVGRVADERFHVRFMPAKRYRAQGDAATLGAPMIGVSGEGAKYWATTFDQLEDKDCDPELICRGVGINYTPGDDYCLAIIDSWAAKDAAGIVSIVPTFHELAAFANRELPKEFPPAVTDVVMNAEFQQAYSQHHGQAVAEGLLESVGDNSEKGFSNYLKALSLDETEEQAYMDRFKMHHKLGNNEHYSGNGLTKNLIQHSENQNGVVETFNFERKRKTIGDYKQTGAIHILTDELKPL